MEYIVYKVEKPTTKILEQRSHVKADLIKWLNNLSVTKENMESSNNDLLSDKKERKI